MSKVMGPCLSHMCVAHLILHTQADIVQEYQINQDQNKNFDLQCSSVTGI